ncbi:ITGA7 [Cordylochernes scorpioides]|uniref:ITGA7 n=1 Tax=Cordylochernes scorpioides TaxID=51811 RepID=A0ABY6L557_9ARAC|nr:ITGA7 [Cordylochernes scorpioides]
MLTLLKFDKIETISSFQRTYLCFLSYQRDCRGEQTILKLCDSRSGNGSYDLHLGEKQLLLVVNVTNTAEPAYDTALYLFHSSQLSFIGRSLLVPSSSSSFVKTFRGEQVECFPQNATVLKCELGNPMTRGELEFQIKMSPKMVGDHETELDFRLLLNTAQWRQECCGRQIINNGPWHVPELRLVINWPWRLADSKEDSYLLYVLASPTVIGDGFCTLELDSVNPLRLKVHLTG